MKIKTKIISFTIVFFLLVNLISAQSLENRVKHVLGVLKDRINEVVSLIFCLIWWIIAALAALLIVWNAVVYITSEDFKARIIVRRRIIQIIIGLVIVLIACPLVNFLIKGTKVSEFRCECIPGNETIKTTTTTIATTPIITMRTTTKTTTTTLTTSTTILTTTAISTTTTIQSESIAKIRAKEEADWIVSKCKRPSGALSIAPDGGINPYFANLAAQALLEVDESYKKDVKDYILWYIAHLNKPDNLGVYGTIYDYSVVDGVEKPLENYDSSDSYAATFLSLVRRYYDKSGDSNFIKNNLNNLKLIAGAMNATLQEDGLTWAKKNYQIKFLMDNIEVWQGYRDFAYLLDVIGDIDAEKYREKEGKVREGIENQLWNEKNQEYKPYVGGKTNWNKFYPDASANLWPIIFDLPEAKARQSILWQKFISHNPKWKTNQADAFPWTVNNIAALKAGDKETAKEFDANTRKKFLPERKWPWNINDAGWYIRYTLLLED
ncbi:MAG: hypothetical protein QW802_00015 [Candidatus Altiarchaeota archaeon]